MKLMSKYVFNWSHIWQVKFKYFVNSLFLFKRDASFSLLWHYSQVSIASKHYGMWKLLMQTYSIEYKNGKDNKIYWIIAKWVGLTNTLSKASRLCWDLFNCIYRVFFLTFGCKRSCPMSKDFSQKIC